MCLFAHPLFIDINSIDLMIKHHTGSLLMIKILFHDMVVLDILVLQYFYLFVLAFLITLAILFSHMYIFTLHNHGR